MRWESGGGGDRAGGLDAGDEFAALAGEGPEVAFHLDAVPEGVGLAEEDAETDGHGRGDGALAEHDLVDRPGRHADGAGHGILGNAHGLEVFLQQYFAGSDGSVHGCNVWRHSIASMVIHDGDFGRPRSGPAKDDAPLIIDADGVVARKPALEEFEPIAWRNREIVEPAGLVQLDQFPQGDPCDGSKGAMGLGLEQNFRIRSEKDWIMPNRCVDSEVPANEHCFQILNVSR